ncbi:rod shape-determining protein MreD [candidate division NPL-UPA2 bacterium]|nr:rod shape-determining protein MreD [candidate division NPL-UPA2 bacterium]
MSIFLWALLLIIASVLQTTLLSPEQLHGVRPDLILLLAIFAGLYPVRDRRSYGVYQGEIKGGLVGFLGGLLLDCFSAGLLGMGALCKTVAGALAGLLGNKLYRERTLVQLTVAFLAVIVHELLYLCMRSIYYAELPFLPPKVIKLIFLNIAINTVLALPIFLGLRKLFKA